MALSIIHLLNRPQRRLNDESLRVLLPLPTVWREPTEFDRTCEPYDDDRDENYAH